MMVMTIPMNDHDDANRRFYEAIERSRLGFYLAALDLANAAKAEREARGEAHPEPE